VPINIVEEEDCQVYDKNHPVTMTLCYSTVGGMQQGLLNCLDRDAVDSSFAAITKNTDREFVRAMASALKRRSLQVYNPSQGLHGTIGQAWSPGRAFQPPTHSQDWVQGSHHDARETMLESPAAGKTQHKFFSLSLLELLYGLYEPHNGLCKGSASKMLRTGQDAAGLSRAARCAQDQCR
jgi:hypothetical protein